MDALKFAYQAPCPFCSGFSSQVGSVIQTFAPDDVLKVAATLILPALAYADHDSGKGNKGEKDQDKHISSVPEGAPGIVLLVATIGAVLVFSRRQLRANT